MKNTTITRRLCLDPLIIEPTREERVTKPGSVDKATPSFNRDKVRKIEEFRPVCADATHRFGKSHGSKRAGQ